MLPQYRAALTIGSNAVVESEAIESMLIRWARQVTKSPDLALAAGRQLVSTGSRIDVARHVTQSEHLLLFTLAHSVAEQGITWITEVLIRYSSVVRAYVTVGSEHISPVKRRATRWRARPPALVRLLHETFGASAGAAIASDVQRVSSTKDVDELMQLVASPRRELPVVCVSVDNYTEQPAVDPEALHNRLFGTAHVVVLNKLASRWLRDKLTTLVGPDLSRVWGVYNGAVRLYWPNANALDERSSPYDHPLCIAADIGPSFADDLCREIAQWSAVRPISDWLDARDFALRVPSAQDAEIVADLLEGQAAETEMVLKQKNALEDKLLAAAEQLETEYERYQKLARENEERKHVIHRLNDRIRDLQSRIPDDDVVCDWSVVGFRAGNDRDVIEDVIHQHESETVTIRSQLRNLERTRFWQNSAGKLSKLEDGLFEFRVDVSDHWLRLFVTQLPSIRTVVVLHAYAKQQNALDQTDVATARMRLRRLQGR